MLPMPVMTLMMVVVVRCGGVDSNEAGHIWAPSATLLCYCPTHFGMKSTTYQATIPSWPGETFDSRAHLPEEPGFVTSSFSYSLSFPIVSTNMVMVIP